MKTVQNTASVLLAMVLLFTLLPAAGITLIPTARAADADWTYAIVDGTARISYYNGFAVSVTVPSKLEGYPVTSISGWWYSPAFHKTVRSITLPDTITAIGAFAFYELTELSKINLPKNLVSIGEGAFTGCPKLTKFTLPNSLETIGRHAFARCTGLTSVTLGKNVSIIGVGAFDTCTKLTKFTVPDSVTVIGDSAFANCAALTSVTIGKGVTEIGANVFYGNKGLTSVVLPDNLTRIRGSTFEECSNLIAVYIGENVAAIEERAFRNCTSLEVLPIPNATRTLYVNSFEGCPKLTIYCNKDYYAQVFAAENKLKYSLKAAPQIVYVTFNKNGGSGSIAKQLYLTNTSKKLTANKFTRKDYVFAGWATSKTGKVKYADKKSIKITKNTTLYAVWTKVAAPTKAVTSLKLTSPKTKQLKVTYKAVSGAAGYRIQYSTSKNFTKATTKTVHTTKLTYTLKSLTAKKKYYVRVTSYKTDSTKAKAYSSKHATKNLTVK